MSPAPRSNLRELVTEADAAHALIWQVSARERLCHVLTHIGQPDEGRAVAMEALEGAAEIGQVHGRCGLLLAEFRGAGRGRCGCGRRCQRSRPRAVRRTGRSQPPPRSPRPRSRWRVVIWRPRVASRRKTSRPVAGWFTVEALVTRTRVAFAENEPGQAERDAHEALARAAELRAHLFLPDLLEILARFGTRRRQPFGGGTALRRSASGPPAHGRRALPDLRHGIFGIGGVRHVKH